MTIHTQNDLARLEFATTVNNSAVVLQLSNAATSPLNLYQGDTLVSDYRHDTGLAQVDLQVADPGSYTMEVHTNIDGAPWPRADGKSRSTQRIPSAGNDVALTLNIVARDDGGAVVARRSQVVIIKHKSTP